jgi:hypothetical protein
MAETLSLGTLLMSNILAVGIMIGRQCPGSRPFLLGFEVFGAMALALYVALASFLPDPWLEPCLAPSRDAVERIIGRDRPLLRIPILIFVYVVQLGAPQVAFALVGGFLSRRLKITVTRRRSTSLGAYSSADHTPGLGSANRAE